MSNLVPNNGFENGTASWTSSAPAELSSDNTLSHTGNASLRLTTSDSLATSHSAKFTLLPNRFYRLTAFVYAPVPAEVRVEQFTSTGAAGEPNYPAWSGVIEGAGWQAISTVFITASNTTQAQIYLLLKTNGSVNFDDISVQLLPAETPFAIGTGADDFLGHPSIMGMRIVNSQLSQDGKTFSLDTTGAHFQFDADTGLLRCTQTLGGTRDQATFQLPLPTTAVKVLTQNSDRVILSTDKFDLAFHGNSMVVMSLASGTQATVTKNFTQAYYGYREGFLTAIDDIGGVAVFLAISAGLASLIAMSYPRVSELRQTHSLIRLDRADNSPLAFSHRAPLTGKNLLTIRLSILVVFLRSLFSKTGAQ